VADFFGSYHPMSSSSHFLLTLYSQKNILVGTQVQQCHSVLGGHISILCGAGVDEGVDFFRKDSDIDRSSAICNLRGENEPSDGSLYFFTMVAVGSHVAFRFSFMVAACTG
jgi:hypothetical protein